MKTVCIAGGSFTGNHGAEAMLITCISRIRERASDTRFIVMTPCVKADRAVLRDTSITLVSSTPVSLVLFLFPLSLIAAFLSLCKMNFLMRILPASIRLLNSSELFIDIAGVSFMDSRLLFLPYNIFSLMPAFLLKIPVIKCAQALGPFKKPLNRFFARLCLSRCKHIFARGKDTLANLKELGISESMYSIAADVAFCHTQGDSLTEENTEYINTLLDTLETRIASGSKLIGICPSSLLAAPKHNRTAYVSFIAQLAERYAQSPYHVVLFPNATRENKMQSYRNNDLRVILDVKEQLNSVPSSLRDNITYIERNIRADDIKKMIDLFEIAIVSRFHAMIAALATHTPVFVLGWSHKYREVMTLCGLEEMIVNYQNMSPDDIYERIDTLLNQRADYVKTIETHIQDVHGMACIQFNAIYSHLNIPLISSV